MRIARQRDQLLAPSARVVELSRPRQCLAVLQQQPAEHGTVLCARGGMRLQRPTVETDRFFVGVHPHRRVAREQRVVRGSLAVLGAERVMKVERELLYVGVDRCQRLHRNADAGVQLCAARDR